jgi:hypothetical protein
MTVIFAFAEYNTAVIVVALPLLRVFFRRPGSHKGGIREISRSNITTLQGDPESMPSTPLKGRKMSLVQAAGA